MAARVTAAAAAPSWASAVPQSASSTACATPGNASAVLEPRPARQASVGKEPPFGEGERVVVGGSGGGGGSVGCNRGGKRFKMHCARGRGGRQPLEVVQLCPERPRLLGVIKGQHGRVGDAERDQPPQPRHGHV
eukprot:scaffold1290_cov115-Isochrysis_galbana.AAC.10